MDSLFLKVAGVFILIIVGLGILAHYADKRTCREKWENSGMRSRYSRFAGCQVEIDHGQWIPDSAYYYKEIRP